MTAPSRYQIETALHVARLLDVDGHDTRSLASIFRHAATDGLRPSDQLDRGLELLIDSGLVRIEGPRRVPTGLLMQLAAKGDDEGWTELVRLLAIGGRASEPADRSRAEVGLRGELLVVDACRKQLEDLGRSDLSPGVQRVSEVSDSFGYDVSAPSIGANPRHLEVKCSSRPSASVFHFFLSRHEYEVGRSDPASWFLVACELSAANPPGIVGHCRALALTPFLPEDGSGRWNEAAVTLPSHLLLAGLPTAVP